MALSAVCASLAEAQTEPTTPAPPGAALEGPIDTPAAPVDDEPESTAIPEPSPDSVPVPDPAPAPEPARTETTTPPSNSSSVTITAEPGRGLTVDAGDPFSMSLRARLQFRLTTRADDQGVDAGIEIKTARIWWTGHVLDPNVRFGIQLALGANDFEPNNASPIFDAFFELRHLRDLQLRVGQFFVPFDRARTIREFALQTVDRTDVVRELTLDRDVGAVVQSTDLFGLGGALSYHLGVFGGDGRNRLGAAPDAGFLYVGRVSVRPFGGFDDDQEGDLARSPNPRLAVGAAFAFNHQTDRPRSTTGTAYQRARFDYLHLAADLVFKWAGLSLMGEIVWREPTNGDVVSWTDDAGNMRQEWARAGWGYLVQLGVMVHPMVELWSRWEEMHAREGTDPAFITQVRDRGRGLSAGLNVYVSGHLLKVQADWSHSFGDDFLVGAHLVRLQLDASF